MNQWVALLAFSFLPRRETCAKILPKPQPPGTGRVPWEVNKPCDCPRLQRIVGLDFMLRKISHNHIHIAQTWHKVQQSAVCARVQGFYVAAAPVNDRHGKHGGSYRFPITGSVTCKDDFCDFFCCCWLTAELDSQRDLPVRQWGPWGPWGRLCSHGSITHRITHQENNLFGSFPQGWIYNACRQGIIISYY